MVLCDMQKANQPPVDPTMPVNNGGQDTVGFSGAGCRSRTPAQCRERLAVADERKRARAVGDTAEDPTGAVTVQPPASGR